MSNLLYPIGLVQQLEIESDDRTLIDAFENGTTTARAYWQANNFKRRFLITHAPLKGGEFKYLKSFYNQRSGQFDSFWFRDNIGRGGNALVRFSQPLYEERGGGGLITLVKKFVNLDEVAPIRAFPEFDELTAAAGITPILWYDANREYYLQHCGSVILDPAGAAFDTMGNYPATWQGGSNLNLGNVLGQYQSYNFSGVEWAKTTANISQLSGTQPACTIFLIARHSTSTAYQRIFSTGTVGTNTALGFKLDGSGYYAPLLGTADPSWSAAQANSPADTWRSFAVAWPASSNTVSLYTNAALIGTQTATRALTNGPAALGANLDGTNICNPGNAMTNCNAAHVLLFPSALTLAQIKAVHNLLGYQYGLATV